MSNGIAFTDAAHGNAVNHISRLDGLNFPGLPAVGGVIDLVEHAGSQPAFFTDELHIAEVSGVSQQRCADIRPTIGACNDPGKIFPGLVAASHSHRQAGWDKTMIQFLGGQGISAIRQVGEGIFTIRAGNNHP